MALLALGVKKGDEIIVPNLTFASTANVVKYCNAKPVLVDIDKNTWNIDPNLIKEKINDKTKAIIPVHLYGNPCDMDRIMEIAKEHNLFVIEDCAEAHGAEYKGKKVGSIGHIGCFSFYGNKIITAGEGGMCVSDDKRLIDKINLLKNYGMTKEKKYWHDVVGYNYRLTNIQAAVALAQIERIDMFIEKREKISGLYKELLGSVKGIKFQQSVEGSKPVTWIFSIMLENFGLSCDELSRKLEKNGVETRKIFYPLNEMPPYANDSKYANSKFISENGLSLPTHTMLTEEEVRLICEIITK